MMSPRRRFGSTPVWLSTICYGTMRLAAPRFSEEAVLTLFLEAFDRGITTFHVSPEYESYDLVRRALKRARAARPQQAIEIVAKFASPHFDETEIDPGRMRRLVEASLAELDVERIDVVQWLVRQTPNTDDLRLATLARGVDAFLRVWNDLRSEGKAISLATYPYSDRFLRHVLSLSEIDGVVSYYNPNERELEPYLDALLSSGRGLIGIRPLSAGAIRAEALVSEALLFALDHPAIAGTIIGLSNCAQIDAAVTAATKAEADRVNQNSV